MTPASYEAEDIVAEIVTRLAEATAMFNTLRDKTADADTGPSDLIADAIVRAFEQASKARDNVIKVDGLMRWGDV
jgi:hypothetical protein